MIKSNFFLKHKKKIIFCIFLIILLGVGVGVCFKFKSRLVFSKQKEIKAITEYAEAKSGDIGLTITGSGAIASLAYKAASLDPIVALRSN